MRSLRRWALALSAGAAAWALVTGWPASPRWVAPPAPGRSVWLVGFPVDGHSAFLQEGSLAGDTTDSTVDVVERAPDGTELSRVTLPVRVDDFAVVSLTLLPPGDLLLAHEVHFRPDGTRPARGTNEWGSQRYALHDARTGARRHGPFPFEGFHQLTFSPDGRWMETIIFRDPAPVRTLFTVRTGEILTVGDPAEMTPGRPCQFSPDSTAIAILSLDGAAAVPTINIYDLPAATCRGRFPIPPFESVREVNLKRWAANRLAFIGADSRGPALTLYKTFTCALTQNGLGPPRHEPRLDGFHALDDRHATATYHQEFGDRVVRTRMARSWWSHAVTWVNSLLGKSWRFDGEQTTRTEFLTRTGRSCLETEQVDTHFIAPTGRWFVRYQNSAVTGFWDADPLPRWPAALAGSFLVTVVVLLPTRRRKLQAASP